MAKHIIELDFYEDRNEIDLIIHCKDAYEALWDIQQMLRSEMNTKDMPEEQYQLFEKILEHTYRSLEYYI